MSEERARKRRKARKEPTLVELSRLTLDLESALVIRLTKGVDAEGLKKVLLQHLPKDTTVFVVDRQSRVEIVIRGQQEVI